MKCFIRRMDTSWDRKGRSTMRLDLVLIDKHEGIDWGRPVYITNDPPDQPQPAPPPTAKPDQGRAFDLGDKTE